MMILERSSLFCIHFTESHIQGFIEFKIQSYRKNQYEVVDNYFHQVSDLNHAIRKYINMNKKHGLHASNENNYM